MTRIVKPKSLPNALTLIMMVIVLAAISTWLLPSGQYSKLSAENNKAFVVTSTAGQCHCLSRNIHLTVLVLKFL